MSRTKLKEPQKTYDQRFAEWKAGQCPYCGGKEIEENTINLKWEKVHFSCKACGAQNYFSRGKREV